MSYENAPLPAQQKKQFLTEEEEEEERMKQEIWEAVNKTRQERHEREERERKEREARRKAKRARNPNSASKPRKPALPDDSEASEKLLEQRKKLEADRKRFAQMRAAAKRGTESSEVDIVIASPSSPKQPERTQRRNQTPGPSASSAPSSANESPEEDSSHTPIKARPIPMVDEPVYTQQPQETNSRPVSVPRVSNEPTAVRSTGAPSAGDDEWKKRYFELQQRFEAEQQAKGRIEDVLAQYENTINSLMMEQENAVRNESGDSSGEILRLREENKELLPTLDATQAELEAVSGDHFSLAERYKVLTAQLSAQKKNEQNMKQQIQNLQTRLEMQNTNEELPEQSAKLERYRVATSKQIEVLKLRFTKAESQIQSLKIELQGKTEENEKLTQISDSLIAMLESADLGE